jgi:hypothetical protein
MKFLLTSFTGILGVIVFIEVLHVKAHRDMEVDVHGHCMSNKEGIRRVLKDDSY